MKSWVFVAFFALALSLFVVAISGSDAVNYIVTSNHFLYEGETYTPPNVTILQEQNSYWVIPLTAGNTIVTYFAIDAQSGELSVSRSVNRELFEIADKLREIQLLKASISSNSGADWIFTQKYQAIFNELSVELSDEIFQLNTVQSTLEDNDIDVDMTSLKNSLRDMSSDSSSIAAKISGAGAAESEFVTSPSGKAFLEMDSSFNSIFESIDSLNSKGILYKSNLDKLKQQISVADLDTQTKSQLFSILEIPQGLQALRNYNLYSTQLQGSLTSTVQASSLRMDAVLSEFDNRVQKNDAYNLIYSENEKIKKDTDFLTLTEAKNYILSQENRGDWQDQSKVRELEQNYARAIKFYDERNFGQSEKFAAQALDDALAVYKKGAKQIAPSEGISQQLLFQIAAGLVAILVLLYIFNNRGKIKGIISKEPTQEVDLYA